MTLGHGPKIITKGLGFAYDMGPNPGANKSWKGKPTTNYLNGSTSGTYPDAFQVVSYAGDGARAEVGTSQFGTKIIQWTATGSTYIYTRDQILDDDLATLSGQTVTFSLYIRRLEGSATGRIRVYDNVSNYSYQSVSVTSVFQRVEMTKTLGANPTRIFVMLDNTGGGTYQFHSPQLEISSFATPFTYSSRSNTEAIIDWTGNATITATSPTYNSDGSFTFNSGTERLDISNSIPISNNFSWSAWIRSNNISQTQNIVSMNGPYFMRISNSRVRFNILTNSGGWLFQNGTTVLSSDTWYNLCMVWNGADNTWTGYINGEEEFSVSKSGTVTNSSLYGYVGYTPQGGEQSFFNGDIPVLLCHTKALTAAEVAQNFQALRGRYGI